MNLLRLRPSPNQSRFAYDILVSVLAAAATFAFGVLTTEQKTPALFLGPVLLIALNYAFGLYTRFKVGAGGAKALRLSTGLIVSTAAMVAIAPEQTRVILLWPVLLWSPLCLPRIFLNISTRASTNFLSSAIKGRGPVLVVGGAGYIGTHVIAQLLAADYSVRVLDRLLYGKAPLDEFFRNPRFELVEGDATDIVKLVEAMTGVSSVIHLAGLVGDPACSVDEGFTRHANVITTRMVKEVALSMGVSRFIFASSCSVYGATDKEVDETSELNPVSLYARTKIDSERELLLCKNENFAVTILRFATVFGHSRRPRFDLVANLFTAQALAEGKLTLMGENQWRPFIHVSDLARAVVLVLKSDPGRTQGQIFNVGDERLNMTLGKMANIVRDTVAPMVDHPVVVLNMPDVNDRRNYAVSFRKIHRALGFRAATLMEAGVAEMASEFKKGSYGNYRSPSYSNLEVTKLASADFHDPLQSARLYRPLVEDGPASDAPGERRLLRAS